MPRAARSSASNCAVSAILGRMGLRGPLSCIKREGCWSSRGGDSRSWGSSRTGKRPRQRRLESEVRGDQRDGQWCLRLRKMTAIMVVALLFNARSSVLPGRACAGLTLWKKFLVSVPTVFVPFSAGVHAITALVGRGLSGSGIEAPMAVRFVSEIQMRRPFPPSKTRSQIRFQPLKCLCKSAAGQCSSLRQSLHPQDGKAV